MAMQFSICLMKIKKIDIVILSRGRAGKVKTLALFPHATLYVREIEVPDYSKVYPDNKIVAVDNSFGFVEKVNKIISDYRDKPLYLCYDDLNAMVFTSSKAYTPYPLTNTDEIYSTLIETANLCHDAGFSQFSYYTGQRFESLNVIKYQPFGIDGSLKGGGIGIIGNSLLLDPEMKYCCDLDHALRSYIEFGGIFHDRRFKLQESTVGSNNASGYTMANDERLRYYRKLKERWGHHVRIVNKGAGLPTVSFVK